MGALVVGIPSRAWYEKNYAEIAAVTASRPELFALNVIDEIRQYNTSRRAWRMPRKLEVVLSNDPQLNSSAHYAGWRHGYRIVLNACLSELLHDVTDLWLSLPVLIDPEGGSLAQPKLSRGQVRAALQESIGEYVTQGIWRTPAVLRSTAACGSGNEGSSTAACRDPVRYTQHMLGFVTCHELAHVILKHPKKRIPQTERDQFGEECDADKLATVMMFNYLQSLNYGDYDREGGSVDLRGYNVMSAIKAVAVLFTVLGLIDHVAARLGKPAFNTHPMGGWRYELFKANLVGRCGISAEAFSRPGLHGSSSPDQTHQALSTLFVLP